MKIQFNPKDKQTFTGRGVRNVGQLMNRLYESAYQKNLFDEIPDIIQISAKMKDGTEVSAIANFVMQSTSKNNSKFANISIKDCYNLTQQEKRVLILLATGYNNSQIAKELSISVNTTKVHVCSILQKMNVEDRTQAAIKAIRENLIV